MKLLTSKACKAVALTGIAGLPLALAAGVAEATPIAVIVQHLTFVDHTGPTQFNDVGARGLSVGDTYTFSERVTDHGHQIGFAGGSCTEIRLTRADTSQQCLVTAALPKGQFALQGIATYPNSGTGGSKVQYAITGGTGSYRTARGEVTVTQLDESTDQIDVYLLTG